MARMGLAQSIANHNARSWNDKKDYCYSCKKITGVKRGCDSSYHRHLAQAIYCRPCWIKHDYQAGWCNLDGSVNTEQQKKWEEYMRMCGVPYGDE